MEKKLTKNEKGFVKDFAITGNATKAVKDNFGIKDENYASVKGHRLIRKDKIKKVIKSIADSIPDKLLIEKHLELLTVPKITKIMKRGEYTDIEESTDVQAIKAGLDMAYKLKGAYAPEKHSIDFDVNQFLKELNGTIKQKKQKAIKQ